MGRQNNIRCHKANQPESQDPALRQTPNLILTKVNVLLPDTNDQPTKGIVIDSSQELGQTKRNKTLG